MVKSVQVRAAEATDWPSIVDILESCGLPTDFVGDHRTSFKSRYWTSRWWDVLVPSNTTKPLLCGLWP